MLFRKHGTATAHQRNSDVLRGLLHQPLAAAGGRRRQMELASRQRVLIVVAAADADQLVHLIVVRRDVLVPDGPGNLPSILFRPREVHIRIAQRNPAPHIRFSAASPHTHQVERIALVVGERLLFCVHVKLWRLQPGGAPRTVFPRFHMRPELCAIELRSCIHHQDVHALARQVPGSHTTRCAAADDQYVVNFGTLFDLHVKPDAPGVCSP